MEEKIKEVIDRIEKLSKTKPIKIISHFDTDGITSAAIFSRALERWGKKFSLKIIKSLDEEFIEKLPENEILIFLDLASGSLDYLKNKKTEIFILDHHEITQDIPPNICMINPLLSKEDNCSSAAICYIFAKTLSESNKDLANLAILGMIGDMFDKNITKTYDTIIKDSETVVKKGLLLYPATRPIDKVLEYSSSLYIPGVTGSFKGTLEILKEAGLEKNQRGFKTIAELDEKEMSSLTTAIILRKVGEKQTTNLIGNIFLIKFFNKQEDSRELSALINACSRMGKPEISLGLCLGNKEYKKKAERIYSEYKQKISSALKHASEISKIQGKDYTIINAKDKIKDTIIGTVASIISFSPLYPKGTVIIAMAYDKDKIKVSARLAGREGRNVREILHKAVIPLSGEVGGHPNAAGCLVSKEKEQQLIDNLKNILDVGLVKV